jgi:hypothetical protein
MIQADRQKLSILDGHHVSRERPFAVDSITHRPKTRVALHKTIRKDPSKPNGG